MKRKRRKLTQYYGFKTFVCITVILAVVLGVLLFNRNDEDSTQAVQAGAKPQEQTTEAAFEEVSVKIGSTGDILIHSPILKYHQKSDGSYDFSDIFKYSTELYSSYDYMVANLEVTCAGDEYEYTGYPCFNAPDNIVACLKNSGVDMLLTANNHSYDTSVHGFNRTQQVVEDAGLDQTGTFTQGDKRYIVKALKGIKIGIINYTYETVASEGRKALNGILMSTEVQDYINSFDYNDLDSFYVDIEKNIASMRADGAEAIMVYIHWGDEYVLSPNDYQKTMAQKLCDLGVDVIVGGHPHVVEPIDILSSEISNKQTVCLYSMGNAVSNQLAARMNLKTGHTEDGLVFETTFKRLEDGSVILDDIGATPTWANRFSVSGGTKYMIIPLTENEDWSQKYSAVGRVSEMKNSYSRTMDLVSEGIEKFDTEYVKTDLRKN